MNWKIAAFPEEAGVSSKGLLKYLDAVERSGLEHHAILVLHDGVMACKMNFAPYDDQTPHVLFSLSKSFTSAAAGFAVQEGLLRWEDRVCDILPEDMPENPSEWLKSVTLHHLLSMGSGLREESDRVEGAHWARDILACGCDHAPGTHFHYNSHGTYLVSRMVQKVTGQTVRDYLMPRLFDKLGIPKPDFDLSPEGVCCGGFGMHLSCDGIARFGQCLLQNGMWEGEQVLPLEWLEKATACQIDNSEGRDPENDEWAQGYGYQFWRCREGRFRGDGAFGQICLVDRKLNAVVAVTAGINDMGKEMLLLHDYLFPAIGMEPGTEAEKQELQRRLARLSYPWPENGSDAPMPEGTYENGQYLLEFMPRGDEMTVRLREGDHEFCLPFGLNRVTECRGNEQTPLRYRGKCSWQNGKMRLLCRTPDGPLTLHMICDFHNGGVDVQTFGAGFPTYQGRFHRRLNITQVMSSRFSYRGKYLPTPVPREDLKAILEAGLQAPSGCNKQTTSLIAVDEPELMNTLHDLLRTPAEGRAPAMICVLTQRVIAYADQCFAVQDYSAAIENMLLAVTGLGYASVWLEGRVTGKDRLGRKIADVLKVPQDVELVCCLPVGIPQGEARGTAEKMPFDQRAWFNGYGTK